MTRILTIIPYRGLFPPTNGGNLRAFHLLRELARHHDVDAIVLQPGSELKGTKSGYEFPRNVSVHTPDNLVARPDAFSVLPSKFARALRSRWLRRDFRSPASGLLLETHALVRSILQRKNIDVVIFNVVDSLALAPLVHRLCPTALRIANLENVDHVLMEQQLAIRSRATGGDARSGEKEMRRIRETESSLWRHVHGYWAASQPDRVILANLNANRIPGEVIPNGVETRSKEFDSRSDKSQSTEFIFCGSLDYPPNRDALEWFWTVVWPQITRRRPRSVLVVVGRNPSGLNEGLQKDPTVRIVGEVDDVAPYYRRAGVCVVPLRIGSGTRLKILEAMSLGNPVVATSIGAEGLDVRDGEHLLIRDMADEFAAAAVALQLDDGQFEQIRRAARQLVSERYDWSSSGLRMNDCLTSWLRQWKEQGSLSATRSVDNSDGIAPV